MKRMIGIMSGVVMLAVILAMLSTLRGCEGKSERADNSHRLSARRPTAPDSAEPSKSIGPFDNASEAFQRLNQSYQEGKAGAVEAIGAVHSAAPKVREALKEEERTLQRDFVLRVRERMQPEELALVRYELEQAKEEVLRIKDNIVWQQKEIERAKRDRALLSQSLAENAGTDSPGVKMLRRQEVKMRDNYLASTKHILADMQKELEEATQKVVQLEALLRSKTKTTYKSGSE